MTPRVAILVPCYKRPEYTEKCLRALESAQEYQDVIFHLWNDDPDDDVTSRLFMGFKPKGSVEILRCHSSQNQGLRKIVLSFFFDPGSRSSLQFLSKVDNDCLVPANWLTTILETFDKNRDLGIVSPNVFPSNAAFKYGTEDTEGKGYRPAKLVGGVWTMRRELIDGIHFGYQDEDFAGIAGAISILRLLSIEKRPKIGWLENVTFQDLGHWSGAHPDHIKSQEHALYSHEVGRPIAWTPKDH